MSGGSDGESGGSVGGPGDDGYASAAERSSQGSRGAPPPSRHDYLWLGPDHCRVAMTTSVGRNATAPVVCPRLTNNCGYHHRQRAAGNVEPEGGYLKFVPPRGRMVYGTADTPLTRAEYSALPDVDGVNLDYVAGTRTNSTT